MEVNDAGIHDEVDEIHDLDHSGEEIESPESAEDSDLGEFFVWIVGVGIVVLILAIITIIAIMCYNKLKKPRVVTAPAVYSLPSHMPADNTQQAPYVLPQPPKYPGCTNPTYTSGQVPGCMFMPPTYTPGQQQAPSIHYSANSDKSEGMVDTEAPPKYEDIDNNISPSAPNPYKE